MTPLALALFLAFGLFLLNLERGRMKEGLRRCIVCGARFNEKHHPDCHYKDRF